VCSVISSPTSICRCSRKRAIYRINASRTAARFSVARLLTHAEQNGYRQIEASERSQQAWVRTIREANESRRTYLMHSTPGYFNVLWDVARGFFDETYGPGEIEF
jgi:hypothetical protein